MRPNETKTYFWRVRPHMAPTDGEFDCKAWAYFSDVDLVSCGLRGCPGGVGGRPLDARGDFAGARVCAPYAIPTHT